MPNQTEPNTNNALGDLLRAMMPGSLVRSENTQTFPAHPGRHADVLVTTPGRSPVFGVLSRSIRTAAMHLASTPKIYSGLR